MSSPNVHDKKTMRAVVYEGKPFEVKVRDDWPKPTIQMPEDAIVRITTAALCGSEAHIYRGFFGSHNPPWVMGHEAVGIVVEVGSATEQFKVGDRVLIPFGTDAGHYVVDSTLTPDIPMYGAGGDFRPDNGGCQAEYVRVSYADDSLVAIPDTVSSDIDWLFLSDIFPTAWAGLDFSGFEPGDAVAVFGCGPVGLMCVYAATLRGASQVFAVDSVRARLDKAASLGAIPIDFTSEDGPASAQILRRRPEGVKRAVDCVGFEAVNHRLKPQQNYVINECICVASVGGGIGQVGVYMASPTSKGVPRGGEVDPVYEINLSEAWPKSLSIKMGVCPIYELLPRLFELVRTGRARLGWLVSATMAIEDAPKAYERFEKKLETKVVFRFPWAHGVNWDVAAAVTADEERGVTNGKNGHRSEIPIPKKKLPIHSHPRNRRPFVG